MIVSMFTWIQQIASWFTRDEAIRYHPQRRRTMQRARRLAAACCAGFAMMCALQVVVNTTRTQPVIVATRAIARGATITHTDIEQITVPYSTVLHHALTDHAQLNGALAQIDIAAGDVLIASMIGTTPTLPAHHTVIHVRVAGDTTSLPIGSHVQLTVVGGCSQQSSCTLSDDAIIMGTPTAAEEYSGALVPVALAQEDAVRVLALPEHAIVVAIALPTHQTRAP